MKVKIAFTIDIDPQSWTENYGIEEPAAVRADLKQYAEIIVHEQLRASGIIINYGPSR